MEPEWNCPFRSVWPPPSLTVRFGIAGRLPLVHITVQRPGTENTFRNVPALLLADWNLASCTLPNSLFGVFFLFVCLVLVFIAAQQIKVGITWKDLGKEPSANADRIGLESELKNCFLSSLLWPCSFKSLRDEVVAFLGYSRGASSFWLCYKGRHMRRP